ncbi:hypothetical protein ACNRBS_03040, partial [Ralstonia pseudosolanacearum]
PSRRSERVLPRSIFLFFVLHYGLRPILKELPMSNAIPAYVLESNLALRQYFTDLSVSRNSAHAAAAARRVLELVTGGALPSYAQRKAGGRPRKGVFQ